MIQPTIGRIVWFHPSKQDQQLGGFAQAHDGRPFAGIVVNVWSDTCVNLAVFDPNGVSHSRTSVYLWQGEEGGPRPDQFFAEWMPYQKGQAAKAEALEQAAKA